MNHYRDYTRRRYYCARSGGEAFEWAADNDLRPWWVRHLKGLRIQFFRDRAGKRVCGVLLPTKGMDLQPIYGGTEDDSGCGCGQRAQKVLDYLGVDKDEEYVRKHHFKATLEGLWEWLNKER